ncbi:TPA: DUF2523 domain-containing protein [Pseudomonas aeruginosa]|nr:DUF2523 domain-containing protein [Pseudomonas aeruginosa]
MWGVLFQALVAAGSYLLPRLLATLGVVAVSETTLKPIVNWLKDRVLSNIGSLPENARLFLEYLGVVDAVSIVFSAYLLLIGIQAAKVAFSKKAAK